MNLVFEGSNSAAARKLDRAPENESPLLILIELDNAMEMVVNNYRVEATRVTESVPVNYFIMKRNSSCLTHGTHYYIKENNYLANNFYIFNPDT